MTNPAGQPAEPRDFDDDEIESLMAAEHAESMRRRRLASLVARDESTLIGVLVSLAEQRARVTLRTSAGWECCGALTSVGTDVVVVRGDDFRSYCVRSAHISTVTPDRASVPYAGNVTGARDGSSLTFDSLLRDMHALDAAMQVVMEGDARAGVASWVGVDLACIVASGTSPGRGTGHGAGYGAHGPASGTAAPCFVRLDAIVAVITE